MSIGAEVSESVTAAALVDDPEAGRALPRHDRAEPELVVQRDPDLVVAREEREAREGAGDRSVAVEQLRSTAVAKCRRVREDPRSRVDDADVDVGPVQRLARAVAESHGQLGARRELLDLASARVVQRRREHVELGSLDRARAGVAESSLRELVVIRSHRIGGAH